MLDKLYKNEDYFKSITDSKNSMQLTSDISTKLKLNKKNRDILVMKPVEYKAINRQ